MNIGPFPSHSVLLITSWFVLGLAYLALTWQQLRYGIEYDEGWNLTVIRNFAEGQGYTTTGLHQWTWSRSFDPVASTGPTLLIPGSGAWWLSGGSLEFARVVPIGFFFLLVISLAVLFGRIAGAWGAFFAAASPLLLSVSKADISTVSLVPGRFVGEIAATACLVLMALLLASSRPLLAGVVGGLAIQAKIHFLLPVGVLGIAWLVLAWSVGRRPKLGTLGLTIGGVAIPLLAFEVFRFAQLGQVGYLSSVKEQVAWLIGQGTAPDGEPFLLSAGRRLGGLLSVYSLGGAIILVACIGVVMVLNLARLHVGTQRRASESLSRALSSIVALSVAASSIFIWWMFLPPEKLPRVGIPVLLIASPVVLVACLMALRAMMVTGESAAVRNWGRAGSLALGAGLVGLVLWQGMAAFTNDFGARMLSEQRAASSVIQESGTASLPMDWVWNLAQFQILAGVPAETLPGAAAPSVAVYDSIRARTDFGVDDARVFIPQCDQVLYSSQSSVVCSAFAEATR